MKISVIIPTYNRKRMLQETLHSLSEQSIPTNRFEVIVVDDGSKDGTHRIDTGAFPYRLTILRQKNQGDASARNLGAHHSQNELLVFLDDDVVVEAEYLEHIVGSHEPGRHQIVVGAERLVKNEGRLPENLLAPRELNGVTEIEPIPFADVCSNNMSVRSDDYIAIGMMQDLDFPGSSIWCDVEFSYRAARQGFEFIRNNEAVCWHRDYVRKDLDSHGKRAHESAYRAVALFQRHPELAVHLPMFADKTPMQLPSDGPALLSRKLLRMFSSSKPVTWTLRRLYYLLKRTKAGRRVNKTLYRWLIGSEIYRGYREGLRQLRSSSATQKRAAAKQ